MNVAPTILDKAPAILSSDIDRTLLPSKNLVINREHPAFPGSLELKQHLTESQKNGQLLIVYNSGRALNNIRPDIATQTNPEGVLARPAAIIANVGTEIYMMRGDKPVLLQSWEKQLAQQFPPALRTELENKFLKFAARHPGAEMQADSTQGPYKLSFRLTGEQILRTAEKLNKLFSRYENDIRTTFSHGWAFDVTPKMATKGTALKHLAACLKIPHANCIVAGDAGNDVPMFLPEFRGIVVGNADDALRNSVGHMPRDRMIFARGEMAFGVIEGLRELGVLAPQPTPPSRRRTRTPGAATYRPAQ